MLGEVDDSYVDRVLDTAASVDEIGEAIADLEDRFAESRHVPSSTRVADVRVVLLELFDANVTPFTFPLQGVPLGHPV